MNSTNIVAVALTSSVVAALVSFISNTIIQRYQFRNEYYKQLLAKRLAAYEATERVLTSLIVVADYEPKGDEGQFQKFTLNSILFSKQRHEEWFSLLAEAMNRSLWLSHGTTKVLTKLNALLMSIKAKIRYGAGEEVRLQSHDERVKAHNIAKEFTTKLTEVQEALDRQVRIDLRSLHNINSFVN